MPKKFFRQVRAIFCSHWPLASHYTSQGMIGRAIGPWLQRFSMLEPPSDEYFMREALRMAQKAYDANEVPVGAVVVRESRIIARAYNQVELLKDATAHAEMLALTQAEAAVGDWRLIDCDLYVTKE